VSVPAHGTAWPRGLSLLCATGGGSGDPLPLHFVSHPSCLLIINTLREGGRMTPFLCSARTFLSVTSANSAPRVMAFARIACLGAFLCPIGCGRARRAGAMLRGLCARSALSLNSISIPHHEKNSTAPTRYVHSARSVSSRSLRLVVYGPGPGAWWASVRLAHGFLCAQLNSAVSSCRCATILP